MARCTFPTSLLFSYGLLVLDCFPRNVMAGWSAVAESKVSYTDDVTNFSAARRLKFSEDPSQPTGIPTQLSDVIWDPSLELIRSSSSTPGPNELSIKAAGSFIPIIRSSTTATTACNSSKGFPLTRRSFSVTGMCPTSSWAPISSVAPGTT
jgi:hypothetical protein